MVGSRPRTFSSSWVVGTYFCLCSPGCSYIAFRCTTLSLFLSLSRWSLLCPYAAFASCPALPLRFLCYYAVIVTSFVFVLTHFRSYLPNNYIFHSPQPRLHHTTAQPSNQTAHHHRSVPPQAPLPPPPNTTSCMQQTTFPPPLPRAYSRSPPMPTCTQLRRRRCRRPQSEKPSLAEGSHRGGGWGRAGIIEFIVKHGPQTPPP